MLNVVVVDDEAAGRRAVTRLIASHIELNLVGQASSASRAISLIEKRKPDVVFLDIEMVGGDGFRVLAAVQSLPKIVFISAHADHAPRAFDVEAVDFLLKPVQPARFARTVRRLRRFLPDQETSAMGPLTGKTAMSLIIPLPRGKRLVQASEILAIVAEGDDSRVHLTENAEISARQSIGTFARRLPAPPFQRLGRSLILNMDRIASIETITRDSTRISLRGGKQELVVGRKAATMLRRLLTEL